MADENSLGPDGQRLAYRAANGKWTLKDSEDPVDVLALAEMKTAMESAVSETEGLKIRISELEIALESTEQRAANAERRELEKASDHAREIASLQSALAEKTSKK